MARLLLYACATALMAGAAVPAAAADRIVTQTGTIKTRDLNLTLQRDARTLLRRATARVDDLCAETDSSLNRDRRRSERACAAAAMARLVSQLNAPMVTAEYAREQGRLVNVATTR
jgi:UrcA family protein